MFTHLCDCVLKIPQISNPESTPPYLQLWFSDSAHAKDVIHKPKKVCENVWGGGRNVAMSL